ncbi:MAG: LysR family transcriptional regulator, partial [Deltaproteobacteria bacterium]|nr:LysR family transcriptional regulator [Deltaproteobacteria bacterium]
HREDYALVGAPSLLDGAPLTSMEDAGNHTLVDVDRSLPLFRYWRNAPGGSDSMEFGHLRQMGTIEAIATVVRAGEGIAVLPKYLIREDLARGGLVVLLPDVEPLHDWFRLVFRRSDPRVPLFRSLAEVMTEHELQ